MKLFNRKDLEILETSKFKFILGNGEEYSISEEHGELVLNKIDGSISIFPRYSNEIIIK